MQITFRAKFPWALLPTRAQVDKKTADADAEMYAQNFRWVRRGRSPERCIPWRLAHATGWIVPSPIDIRIGPVASVPVALSAAERNYLLSQTGLIDFAPNRTGNAAEPSHLLVTEATDWLELYEVKCGASWENMFVPLGDGFVEWRLGWELELPPNYAAMLLPIFDPEEMEVASGPLEACAVTELNRNLGLTLVVRPHKTLTIRRRQPLAQLILLETETLAAQANFVTLRDSANTSDEE